MRLQGAGLCVRRAVVDDHCHLPVARGQVRREPVAEDEVDARKIGVIELAAGDMEDIHAAAFPVRPRGQPSTGHGQIIWQLQLPTYFPDISQDMRTLLAGAVAKQKRPGFSAENT